MDRIEECRSFSTCVGNVIMGEKAFIFVQDKTSESQLFDQTSLFSNIWHYVEKVREKGTAQCTATHALINKNSDM